MKITFIRIGLAVMVAAGTVCANATDYLCTVGPASLRLPPPSVVIEFSAQTTVLAPPPKPVADMKPMVPKFPEPPTKPAPSVFVAAKPVPVTTNVVVAVKSPPSSKPVLPLPSPAPVKPVMVAPSTTEMAVTPHMVVEFFKKHGTTTNSDRTFAVVPLEFIPPAPVVMQPPSSKATYSSPSGP